MSSVQAPLRELHFIFEEVFQAENLWRKYPLLQQQIGLEQARTRLLQTAPEEGASSVSLDDQPLPMMVSALLQERRAMAQFCAPPAAFPTPTISHPLSDAIEGVALCQRAALNVEKSAKRSSAHQPEAQTLSERISASTQACRALTIYTAKWLDLCQFSANPRMQQEAQQMVKLLVPVCSSFIPSMAKQNNRQAAALMPNNPGLVPESDSNDHTSPSVTLKPVSAFGGPLFDLFVHKIKAFFGAHHGEEMMEFTLPLTEAVGVLEVITARLRGHSSRDPKAVEHLADKYRELFGYCLSSYMWAMMAKTALNALNGPSVSAEESVFYQRKLDLARGFNLELMAQIQTLAKFLDQNSSPTYTIAGEPFYSPLQ